MRHWWIAGAAAALLGAGGGVGSQAAESGSAAAAVTSYHLAASGTGLRLTLAGRTVVAAASAVSAGTGAPVDATGTGELTPTRLAARHASAATPGASQTEAAVCAAHPSSSFPGPFAGAVTLDAACGAASARESTTGRPAASATGSVGSLAIGPPAGGTTGLAALRGLLPTPVTPGSTLASALAGVLGPLPPLPSSGLPLATVVQQAAAKATGSTVSSLVAAALGPSTSEISPSGGTLHARSVDTGASIAVLTGAGARGGPLLTVHIGQAVTTAGVDLATGKVTEDAAAASVTVSLTPPAGTQQTVSVTPGGSKTFFTGTPLQTTVSVSAPSTTSNHGLASASGVVVDLPGGSNPAGGGVALVLGAATAQATATAPPQAPPRASAATSASATAPVLAGTTTVHTGEPWAGPLPMALLVLSLLAGTGLLARRQVLGLGHLAARIAGRLVRRRDR